MMRKTPATTSAKETTMDRDEAMKAQTRRWIGLLLRGTKGGRPEGARSLPATARSPETAGRGRRKSRSGVAGDSREEGGGNLDLGELGRRLLGEGKGSRRSQFFYAPLTLTTPDSTTTTPQWPEPELGELDYMIPYVGVNFAKLNLMTWSCLSNTVLIVWWRSLCLSNTVLSVWWRGLALAIAIQC
jgi:hypothetical protein